MFKFPSFRASQIVKQSVSTVIWCARYPLQSRKQNLSLHASNSDSSDIITRVYFLRIRSQQLFAFFWWQGVQKDQDKKPIHYRSWESICKPKKEGGLGIRNLELVNKGMLISKAWRLVHDPESFVVKIIKSKYYSHNSFWTAATYIPKSTFWSSILSIRHHLEQNVTIQFIDGNTSIWNQPWSPFWRQMHERLNLEQSIYQIPD